MEVDDLYLEERIKQLETRLTVMELELDEYRKYKNIESVAIDSSKLKSVLSDKCYDVNVIVEDGIFKVGVGCGECQTLTNYSKVNKSYNKLRKELIQEAKEFVADLELKLKTTISDVSMGYGLLYKLYSVTYNVNIKNKTVGVELKGIFTNTTFYSKSVKCLEEDVFNVHLGKAIALGKLLGIDVDRFENAVQPIDLVVGQIVKSNVNGQNKWKINNISDKEVEVEVVESINSSIIGYKSTTINDNWHVIVDDSNAKY